MNTSDDLVLRSLDSADTVLSPEQQRRANDLLARVLATPIPSGGTESSRSRRRRWWTRKLAWVPAAAAAVGVASVVFPGIGGSGVSYASWTATPSTVAAHDLEVVGQACRDKAGDARSGPGGAQLFDPATIPVELAERRGDFVAILFVQENPAISVACVATNWSGSMDVDNVTASVGGGDGPAWTPPPGQIRPGSVSQFGGGSPASFTDGTVGEDVVAVTVHAGPQTVTATVRNGRYAAWWPGKAFADGPLPPSGQGGPEETLTYDLTLTDRTVKTNVTPAIP